MMNSSTYRFASVWQVDAAADRVFAALTDLATYPLWWRDVRAVSRVDSETAELVCRTALPYALVFRMTRAVQDTETGRLGVQLSGDLEGDLFCVLTENLAGTRLDISQDVVANKPLLRRLSPTVGPIFRANHALMMWRGQRGFRAHLGS